MRITKAIIPLGGLSTRFLPASKSVPKCMFPVVDKPIIQYLIEELSACGVTEILILLGRNNEAIQNHFDKAPELESILLQDNKLSLLEKSFRTYQLANISYKRLPEPKGVADALLQAKSFICNEPFVLIFGDEMLYNKNCNAIEQMLKVYNKTKQSVIGCYNVDKKDTYKYGIMQLEEKNGVNKVISIVEKPKPENAPSTLSAIGKYILEYDFFDILQDVSKNFDKEKNFTDSLNMLAKRNKLVACEIDGERFDTGNKLGFILANIAYGLRDEEISEELKKQVINLLNL